MTVRAMRLATPIRVDGRLDEALYAKVPAVSDFIQAEPAEGAPATEKTEIWVFFDDEHVYFAARCWESRPDHIIANDMRRDGNIGMNDNIAWTFDTFHDRRSGILLEANPLGGRVDGQTTNEENTNLDWNPVWSVEVERFDGGWTVEAAVPFKSLRYRAQRDQIWGFNVRRRNRWKNEISYLTPIPAAIGIRGLRPSLAGTLVGLEAPPASLSLELKPYATGSLISNALSRPRISNDLKGAFGIDAKYGITQNLTADFTYNTDFAQVEADEQQVNLTRFNLQFPEKREFFLENRSTFAFGGEGTDTPVLFYSRRVGLNDGLLVPIEAGGRMTGRVGSFSLGLVNIQADEEPVSRARATNFGVIRLKRDILRQSSVGVMVTNRSVGATGTGSNTAYGVDGTFSFLNNKLAVNSYWAKTRTDGLSGNDVSYRAQLDYDADRYGVQYERLVVGEDFNPEVGFVRRDDMRRNFGLFRFSPRLKSSKLIRKLFWTASGTYIEDGGGRFETRELDGEFRAELHNADRFALGYTSVHEFLPRSFPIATGIALPVGDYRFGNVRAGYNFGQQRVLAANVLTEYGSFYNGRKAALTVSQGRMNFSYRLSLQPTYSINHVDLDEGSFTTHLVGSRVTFTASPLTFVSALLQFNSTSHAVAANVRLRWEYQAGSELFVVWNEQRDTAGRRFPDLANRSFIVKATRLIRF